MAFEKKEWKDRLVEYAGRRKITNVSSGTSQIVDVERSEGTVSEEGSAFSAANMNDLEQRIGDGFGALADDISLLNSAGALEKIEVKSDGVYITYTPPGGADSVTKKLGNEFLTVATGLNSLADRSIDCTSVPDYKSKTADDFVLVATGFVTYAQQMYGNGSLTKTYNASTGILTVSNATSWTQDYKGNIIAWAVAYNVICYA